MPLPFLATLWALQLASWAAGASEALPADLSDWNIIPEFQSKTRVWDRAALNLSIAHLGHQYHIKHLLEKLDAGEPIVAVAIGSSAIHLGAGRWQPSMDALDNLGIMLNPSLYPPHDGSAHKTDAAWAAEARSGGGFVEAFMNTLNRTWPHPSHVFVNNGRGGSSLQHFAEAGCSSAYMPKQVDIMLIDVATIPCVACPASAETLLRRFLKLPMRPLVFLWSNAPLGCVQDDVPERADACFECLWAHRPEFCHDNLTLDFNPRAVREWDEGLLAPYQALAEHYDVPHVSLADVLLHIVNDQAAQRRLNVSALFMVPVFFDGPQHLHRGGLGTLLAADILVHYLATAQAALARVSNAERDALTYKMPEKVIHEVARHTYHTRCYGLSLNQTLGQASRSADVAVMAAATAALVDDDFNFMHHAEDVTPGLVVGEQEHKHRQVYSEHETLPEMQVVENSGWALQVHYKDKSGNVRIKPGWVAEAAGSAIVFQVDSDFPELPKQQAQLLVTYTSSYSGWGQATVSCVSGCTCRAATIDAAVTVKESLHRIHVITRVTQHPECAVRVEVLATTSSGGHKFKVSALSVRVEEAEGRSATPRAPQPAAR